jgi:hypothetical protein
MPPNYSLRPQSHEIHDDWLESDAASMIDGRSSPPRPSFDDHFDNAYSIPFNAIPSDDLPSDDPHDKTFTLVDNNTFRLSDDQKTTEILRFMKETFPRFSLKLFLTSLFSSNTGPIKNYTNIYLKSGGRVHLMEMVVGKDFLKDDELLDWIIAKASEVCAKECSQLMDRAARGPS